MSSVRGFISPDKLRLSFPSTIATDEQRVLYALWRERVQSIDRLCLHTGLHPLDVIKAVKSLALAGRLRINAEVANFGANDEDTAPESTRESGTQRRADVSDELAEQCVSLS